MNIPKLSIDIGSSSISAIVATTNDNGDIKILGRGVAKSEGIKNGDVVNIDHLADAISQAVKGAKSKINETITKAIVSVSGSYINTRRGNGTIIIQTGQVNKKDIKKVFDVAHHNANIIPEYVMIHLLPISFKIDDIEMDTPLNMTGSRLEVDASIIIAKKSALTNIESSLKVCGLSVENYVLSSYASSLSSVSEKQKTDGCCLIDIGAGSIDMVILHNKAVLYNMFLPFGSNHITQDLSEMLDTHLVAAELIKNQYGTLTPYDDDTNIKDGEVEIPSIREGEKAHNVTKKHIQLIVHARVEEMLLMAKQKLVQSEMGRFIRSGIVLSGGICKIEGIVHFAKKVFEKQDVNFGKTSENIDNEFIDFKDSSNATIIGLLYYSLNKINVFELDSKKELKSSYDKIDKLEIQQTQKLENVHLSKPNNRNTINISTIQKESNETLNKVKSMLKEWF